MELQPFLTVNWKLAKRYDKDLDAAAPSYGLTRNEKDVLLFLYNNAPLNTAGEIVKYRCISKSLVAKSVASLTKRGYLSQKPDQKDARFVRLEITGAAMQAVRELKEAQNRFFSEIAGSLSEEERGAFLALLARIGKDLNQEQ